MNCVLDEEKITFGKYKDLYLCRMLKDRNYCSWLLQQEWFKKNYEYLYNRVTAYQPIKYFINKNIFDVDKKMDVSDFLNNYPYFHLTKIEDLEINLDNIEKKCYSFYLDTIDKLREKIIDNIGNLHKIKAPSSWLKKFEDETKLSRDVFKEFLYSYALPNVPYIVEDIKKLGGVSYKGAKSFLIAKEKSLKQENFWENLLKKYYGEDIGSQYKFRNCFFDFIRIKTNTLYECKLGLKDFNEEQHKKYLLTLESTFSIIYLISDNCIIDLCGKKIYTTDKKIYSDYFLKTQNLTKLDMIIKSYEMIELNNIDEYFISNNK